jgi:hypothetical protein
LEDRGAGPVLLVAASPTQKASAVLQRVLEKGGGDGVDAVLLRHVEEVQALGIVEGAVHRLDMREMGVAGWAWVRSVEPCPPLEAGAGQLVTGWFHHWRSVVYDLRVEGEPEPIRVTALHPFWSVDRQSWVPLSELQRGERLSSWNGSTPRVESLTLREEPEPVYNIEVEGDHCYRVGQQGLLVHNASIGDCQFLGLTFTAEPGVNNGIKYFDTKPVPGGGQRATGVQARLTIHTPKGTSATYTPTGFPTGINPPRGAVRVARGHLLGNQLGGSGSDPRNIVPICHQTVMVQSELEDRNIGVSG